MRGSDDLSAKLTSLLLMATWSATLGQGYAPEEAAARMRVAEGLRVRLFASEPEIRQPILVKCDDRGRLWTIQYLQYPNPAGLKRVEVDRWSRTVYDRIPEPPPHGPKGADRIAILEDRDGDGRADRYRDFVDGLNLATGLEFGYGGVFVLNVPYLLFYPDRDRDDVPDGDPEVLLSGFGMEDAQSLANHLTWGPDGWLYGVNGSTTTCRIRGIEFQQGCWRYHPRTKAFELFCEGGSNTFGLTFDANGELLYSTNAGPFVHAVQGGYYYKSFGKHGPLHNRYAFGYLGPLAVDAVPGGPPTGGTVYLGEMLPAALRGRFVAGNFLGHSVSWWEVLPRSTTFEARYGGVLIDSKDTWFGPTDLCVGPDGAIYVSDFHDERTAHPDPDANWDRSNGRIFRIDVPEATRQSQFHLSQASSADLVNLLVGKNRWMADRARVELASRGDRSIAGALRELALESESRDGTLAGLWGLNAIDALDEATISALLAHEDAHVQAWTIRLIQDDLRYWGNLAQWSDRGFSGLPARVRLALAVAARRIDDPLAVGILRSLLAASPEPDDERVEWLTWWAIERHAQSHGALLIPVVLGDGGTNAVYQRQAARLMRRFVASGTETDYDRAATLLAGAAAGSRDGLLEALRLGLAERSSVLEEVGQGDLFAEQAVETIATRESAIAYDPVRGPLLEWIAEAWQSDPDDLRLAEIAIRAGLVEAEVRLIERLTEHAGSEADKAAILNLFGAVGTKGIVEDVCKVLQSESDESVRIAGIEALRKHPSDAVTSALLEVYSSSSEEVQRRIRGVLLSWPDSARVVLTQLDSGPITASEITVEELRTVGVWKSPELDAIVHDRWGRIGPGTAEEKLATMRRLKNDLRAGDGDRTRGQEVFRKHCGNCHRLFGAGELIGPDLTTANRGDRDALLANIVDPSAVVRREYLQFQVETSSGQVFAGLLVEQDAASITLVDAKNQRTKLSRAEIDAIRESEQSLMPERILDGLSVEELRDLFAYIERGP